MPATTLDPNTCRSVQARYLVPGDVDPWTGLTIRHIGIGWCDRNGVPFPSIWLTWSDGRMSDPIHAHSYVVIER